MSKHCLILVADDDENDLRMTLEALTQSGPAAGPDLEVRTVHDGAEALDYLYGRAGFKDRPAGNPGVLLLDLKMPRVDGWEVLRQVKADASLRAIPVVVFTSSSRDDDVEQCYKLGANAYVAKPISFREFIHVVRSIRAFWAECNHPPAPRRLLAAVPGPAALPVGLPAVSPS